MQSKSKNTSFNYNLRLIKNFALSLVVILIASVAICSCDSTPKGTEIVDAPSALKAHKAFISKVSQESRTDIQQVISLTKEWFVLTDVLRHHIQHDSVKHRVYDAFTFRTMQDSTSLWLEKLVDAEIRTFEDAVAVREALCTTPIDSIFKNAESDARKFFETLDATQVPQLTKQEAMNSYTTLLKSYLKKDIKSKSDLQRFIRSEDIAFRGFLQHLHELGTTSLANITSSTESICELIFKSVSDGQMSSETPYIYMLMRTNRRIMQNAMICLADIKEGRVSADNEQVVVYLWMMLKPLFPMDELSLSLLTEKQKKDMYTLAKEVPVVSTKIYKGMGWAPLPIEEMPNDIIKEYVSRR